MLEFRRGVCAKADNAGQRPKQRTRAREMRVFILFPPPLMLREGFSYLRSSKKPALLSISPVRKHPKNVAELSSEVEVGSDDFAQAGSSVNSPQGFKGEMA